jgi:hypothetical protein
MTIRRYTVPITVDASGDATVYTPKVHGTIVSLRYVKTNFDDGVDFVVTGETTTTAIWAEDSVNASATRYPRAATHTTAGAASLYASGGTAVNRGIAIADERIKIVVDGGGNAATGTLYVTIDG